VVFVADYVSAAISTVYRQETAWANVEETAQQHSCRPIVLWRRENRSFQGQTLIRLLLDELFSSGFSIADGSFVVPEQLNWIDWLT